MESSYFVRQGNESYGPYPEALFKRLVSSGTIKADAKVSTSEAGPWVTIDQVDTLPFSAVVVDAPKTYVSKEASSIFADGPGYHNVPEEPPANVTGIVGFTLSILSLFTCGVLFPISLVVSLVGIFNQPKGFATAGVVISGFSALVLVGAYLFVTSMSSKSPPDRTVLSKNLIHRRIHEFYKINLRVPRKDEYEIHVASGGTTGFRYQPRTGNNVSLTFYGADREFGTQDDIVYEFNGSVPPLELRISR